MLFPIVIIGLSILIFIIWWLFFETEGVYLGRRMVIWLYDVYATRYDKIVAHDEIEEHLHLAQPILNRIQPHMNPRILDVATGTGRLPLALCQHARFEGHIFALDLSRKMMAQAERKVSEQHFDDFVTFLWAHGQELPFADNSFDVVTCLEAIEFMPDPEAAVAELVRVLRPSGLLLTTQRINQPWMPNRIWDIKQMETVLTRCGVHAIEFEEWQYDYTKVWARKNGTAPFISVISKQNLH